MAITRWKPLHELHEFFEDVGVRFGNDLAVDVYEDKNDVIVEMHIPGINSDKIDIEVTDNHLHITGTRQEEHEMEDRHYYRKEIRRGSFERVVELPCAVVADKTTALYEHGTLKIALPKASTVKNNKVKVTIKP